MLFYRNGEYVMLPGGTSYGYFVVKTTDFITWTGYVRETPAYADENSLKFIIMVKLINSYCLEKML